MKKSKGFIKPNISAKGAKEMSYPNAYKKYNYGGKQKVTNQKVTVKSSGTGKVYGIRSLCQRTLEGDMKQQKVGNLLQGAVNLLQGKKLVKEHNTLPGYKFKIGDPVIYTGNDIDHLPEHAKFIVTFVKPMTKQVTICTANLPFEEQIKLVTSEDTLRKSTYGPHQEGTQPRIRVTRLDEAVLEDPFADPHGNDDYETDNSPETLLDNIKQNLDAVNQGLISSKRSAEKSNDEMSILSFEQLADLVDSAINDIERVKGMVTVDQMREGFDDPVMLDNHSRRVLLKRLIDQGDIPTVVDASYSRSTFSFGDLQSIGYAKRERKVDRSRNTAIDVWFYIGPNSIRCDGRVLNTGDSTDSVEWDPT